jgi:hypothetical protein
MGSVGISMCPPPSRARPSSIALTIAGNKPMEPGSPTPFAPRGGRSIQAADVLLARALRLKWA